MPKGDTSRTSPKGHSSSANESMRKAAASGKAKNYTKAKISDKEFQDEMRMRERGKGTAGDYGYIKRDGMVGTDKTQVTPGEWKTYEK